MSVSIEQAAANLAAALVSGNAQDADVALASYEAAKGEDAPAPALSPLKAQADGSPVAVDAADEADASPDADAALNAASPAEGSAAEVVIPEAVVPVVEISDADIAPAEEV